MIELGKIMLLLGIFFLIVGLILTFLPKFHMPGDIIIKKNDFTIVIPIVTSIIISIILTLIARYILK